MYIFQKTYLNIEKDEKHRMVVLIIPSTPKLHMAKFVEIVEKMIEELNAKRTDHTWSLKILNNKTTERSPTKNYSAIYMADVIIAECSDKKPNVFYMLGLAHAIGVPVCSCYRETPGQRVFAQNNDLCVFPALGGFINGYILLVSIGHYISLFNCPDEIVNSIEHAISDIHKSYETTMKCGNVFFEHGTVSDFGLSSASVSHFHMHFLPVNNPIWELINNKYGFQYFTITSLFDLKEVVTRERISSYLLFGDYDGKIYLINCPPQKYHSQFLRKVMYEYYYGDALNNEWDWKKNPCYELMENTMRTMKGLKI